MQESTICFAHTAEELIGSDGGMGSYREIRKANRMGNFSSCRHKPSGKLRTCLDPRNLNKYIRREHYKLPTREEIIAQFSGAKIFSKLEDSSRFLQIQLDEDSADLCIFIIPFGRYQYKRSLFGIVSAPEIYHRIVHTLFENLPGVDYFCG